ncbi:IS200/IS605 family transposase [Candidatus Sumerlaeota bacterium]|nr:IS200/IS605 family transposase [Candidatus Sumerlaeota bacterium]
MPQSLSRILVHLIFSTKNHAPALDQPIRGKLHAYMTTVLNDHDCPVLQIGGVADHVHLLFGLSRVMSPAQVVEKVKTSSSKWIKSQDPAAFSQFHWQAGYGAFSVSQDDADRVIAYIRNQEAHHRRITFKEEFRQFLERYGIPYDERYVWD